MKLHQQATTENKIGKIKNNKKKTEKSSHSCNFPGVFFQFPWLNSGDSISSSSIERKSSQALNDHGGSNGGTVIRHGAIAELTAFHGRDLTDCRKSGDS